MSRAPETPLILWICAAVCAHFIFAEGGDRVATLHDDRKYLMKLATDARGLAKSSEQTFEIATVPEGKPPEPEQPEPPKPEPVAQKKPEPPKPEKKPDPKKPEPEKKPDAVKVAVKKDDPLKKLDETPLAPDKRIAVRQHVKPEQEDNPNAKFIGDEANHVDQETVATQTSHDEDDPNPTPGANKTAGPQDQVGDSDRTKIAESDEHKGNKDHAPGEKGTEFEVQHDARPVERAQAATAVNQPPAQEAPKVGGDGRTPSQVAMNQPPQLAPGATPAPAPEIVESQNGAAWFNPVQPGAQVGPNAPVAGTTNQNRPLVPQTSSPTRWLGLGGRPGPGQVNINLTQTGVIAAVGVDQLRKEREADGERRKSQHRGSWTASNFERWRNAIENYVSSVKPGNQTSLNTARVPFATYLNTMHNRIHPIFADGFLGSLDGLPRNHPLNDMKLITKLEIVVTKDGHLVKMGVVKTSGITAFDIAALDSVSRAQPFGPAPGAIVSPDGNVYLHWEFHRDEIYACSTMNARPFLLNVPAKPPTAPQPPAPSPKSPSHERGAPPPVNVNETREGALPPRAGAISG